MANKRDVTVGQIEAVFRDVVLPFGLKLDLVKLTGSKAFLRQSPFSIDLDRPGALTVTVSEPNLAEFLELEAPGGLHDFKVKLTEGKVHVQATAKMVFDITAKAICTLRIVHGTELWVDLEDVDVFGVGAKGLVEKQLEKINPVLDVAEFPLKVILEKVTVLDGQVVIQGTASP